MLYYLLICFIIFWSTILFCQACIFIKFSLIRSGASRFFFACDIATIINFKNNSISGTSFDSTMFDEPCICSTLSSTSSTFCDHINNLKSFLKVCFRQSVGDGNSGYLDFRRIDTKNASQIVDQWITIVKLFSSHFRSSWIKFNDQSFSNNDSQYRTTFYQGYKNQSYILTNSFALTRYIFLDLGLEQP